MHHQLQQSQQNCTDMLEALEELEQVTAEFRYPVPVVSQLRHQPVLFGDLCRASVFWSRRWSPSDAISTKSTTTSDVVFCWPPWLIELTPKALLAKATTPSACCLGAPYPPPSPPNNDAPTHW